VIEVIRDSFETSAVETDGFGRNRSASPAGSKKEKFSADAGGTSAEMGRPLPTWHAICSQLWRNSE